MKKTILLLASMILLSSTAFAAWEKAVKYGYEFAGYHQTHNGKAVLSHSSGPIDLPLGDSSSSVFSSGVASIELIDFFSENIGFGLGVSYPVAKSLNVGVGTFQFVPFYAMLKLRKNGYFVSGNFGTNLFSINSAYRGNQSQLQNFININGNLFPFSISKASTQNGNFFDLGIGYTKKSIQYELSYSANTGSVHYIGVVEDSLGSYSYDAWQETFYSSLIMFISFLF